jgi:hypothetical protein
MSVLRRPASIVLTIAALAAAAALAAPAASAAPKKTWTITKGGAVTATTKSFTFEDLTAKASLPCKSSIAKAKLKSGKGLSGTNVGTITSASTSGCAIAGFTVTIKAGHLPWHLNLVSYNSAKGVTTGTLTGIHITFAVPVIGCSAVVDGTKTAANNGMVQVTYTNKTAQLAILKTGGKLHLFSVKNCMGVVNNGDSIALIASYAVTPKQKITSP